MAEPTTKKPAVKPAAPVNNGIMTMTASEYGEYSEKHGRVMGREKGQKTKLTTQELRVLINADWKPDAIMDKHGINDEELKQVVWKLSEEELRESPIQYNKHGFRR
jgi:hypothetical protein